MIAGWANLQHGKDERYTYINSFTRSITIAYTTEEKLIA